MKKLKDHRSNFKQNLQLSINKIENDLKLK